MTQATNIVLLRKVACYCRVSHLFKEIQQNIFKSQDRNLPTSNSSISIISCSIKILKISVFMLFKEKFIGTLSVKVPWMQGSVEIYKCMMMMMYTVGAINTFHSKFGSQ